MKHSLIPPDDLILRNGIGVNDRRNIAAEFDTIGHGLVAEMILGGFIKPHYCILDMGCGLGRLARALVNFLRPPGSYYGIDIVRASIDWCAANYATFPNFHFIYADLFSNEYNRESLFKADDYRFPFTDNMFDFILSTSLFTHMQIGGVDNYLKEMARVLRQGYHMWNTYFLLDDVSRPLASKFDPQRPNTYMPFIINGGRIANQTNPEALIGLETDRVKEIHASHGLEVVEIRNGPWSGRSDYLRASYQDVILARKVPRL